jgi:hypothetical protein
LATATNNGNYRLLRETKHNKYAHSRHTKVTYFLGVSRTLPYIMNCEGLVHKQRTIYIDGRAEYLKTTFSFATNLNTANCEETHECSRYK